MSRVHNFNPGPAALPLAALEQARDELVDFQNSGMSIIEHSHRGKVYEAVHDEALALLRELLAIPASHEVLLLGGSGHEQFAVIPMNFLSAGRTADYVLTGGWSERALEEAKVVGSTRIAWKETDADGRYVRIPGQSELKLDPSAAYVHITSNNTLYGTQWADFPHTGQVPLIADMASDFLGRPLDVSRFGLIYACAQKNVGPSGLVVVIVRKDLIDAGRKDIPKIFRYKTHADARSLYNTPPTFSIYLARNVLAWTKEQGGLAAIEKVNRKKADVLYTALERHPGFYRLPAKKDSRSVMNVVFRLPSEALEETFVAEAKKNGMVGIKGHRSVGGMRASLYNAVSLESVEALASFADSFAAAHG